MKFFHLFIITAISFSAYCGTPIPENHSELHDKSEETDLQRDFEIEKLTHLEKQFPIRNTIHETNNKRGPKRKNPKERNNKPGLIILIVIGSIFSALGITLFAAWTLHFIFGVVTVWWLGLILLLLGIAIIIGCSRLLKKEKEA